MKIKTTNHLGSYTLYPPLESKKAFPLIPNTSSVFVLQMTLQLTVVHGLAVLASHGNTLKMINLGENPRPIESKSVSFHVSKCFLCTPASMKLRSLITLVN